MSDEEIKEENISEVEVSEEVKEQFRSDLDLSKKEFDHEYYRELQLPNFKTK